ncbi:hypothetical protein AB0G35_34530 [Streptomyces sp. NPDC021749]|uniref:hypothetical protein n=1 Tax=Streptomyces sp. NPDC021749 TaxID=3154905 RepID=UPI0033DEF981
MLYESAARAEEILCLNVEDLHPGDKRGRTLAEGGATEWIHWQSGAAHLLPRLIAGLVLQLRFSICPGQGPLLECNRLMRRRGGGGS